jgi:hypothetical protein
MELEGSLVPILSQINSAHTTVTVRICHSTSEASAFMVIS